MPQDASRGRMELIQLCPAGHLLRVPALGISWLFNAWPDSIKMLIQRNLQLNGIVCTDLRSQGRMDTSCNLIEFPLLHALFNQGMLSRGEKPCLLGTPEQLAPATDSFKRGMFGYYDVSEMEGCDLDPSSCRQLLREIEGLSPVDGIQPADSMIDCITLPPLPRDGSVAPAAEVRGLRIRKEAPNVFLVSYGDEHVQVDCNLPPGRDYVPPLELDIKHIDHKLFQIIDTGEEDGFSPRSCMHTLVQWRDRLICIDLPMNVPYLLEQVSVSPAEIDAVLFTHNHDDHIGELSMLLQMDRKPTVLCPRIVWRTILLKGALMLGMEVDELESYFNYVALRYGEEYDYAGLRILAHPSIHSVPCAIYRLRGIVGQEWKSYGHMSDILNFRRCRQLIEAGYLSPERFDRYRDFVLAPTTVKKIDVGAVEARQQCSVHGYWGDFEKDTSASIVLAHIQRERLDPRATVTVGQVAIAGSAREVGVQSPESCRDKYRERVLAYLADSLFDLVGNRISGGQLERQQVLGDERIMADCDILTVQPDTLFLEPGGEAACVDMAISGKGSAWAQYGSIWHKVAEVYAGDLIGEMEALLQVPRTTCVQSDTYMRILRMPGFLFREIVALLGGYGGEEAREGTLHRTWRLRQILQQCRLFDVGVPVHLHNRIARYAREQRFGQGDLLPLNGSLYIGADAGAFKLTPSDYGTGVPLCDEPVYGESGFMTGSAQTDHYQVESRRDTSVLVLERPEADWFLEVPILRRRLRQLRQRRTMADLYRHPSRC